MSNCKVIALTNQMNNPASVSMLSGPGNKKHCCWRWLGNSTTFRVV